MEYLGPDGWVSISATKQRTLLAMLLLYANRSVPAQQLYSELWPDRPQARVSGLLAGCMWRLRAAIGDEGGTRLITTAGGYQFDVPPGAVDLHVFQTLLAEGRARRAANDLVGALDSFTRSLEVWRGDALADVAATPSIMAEQSRLEESRLSAVEGRCGVEIDLGRHEEVLPELKRLVAQHPLRERLHGLLMTALYRCGQQAEALGVYRDLRNVLVEELGVEPSRPLRDLHQRILLEDPGLLTTIVPAAAKAAAAQRVPAGPIAKPQLLPPPPRVFVAREDERRKLAEQLVEPDAVVSVHGAAGMGKSALALVAAHDVADHFADGQVAVDMRGSTSAPLRPIDAMHQVCEAFGVVAASVVLGHDQALPRWPQELSNRRVLLVLDDVMNMRQVGPLLSAAPSGWSILLTGCSAVGAVDSRSHLLLSKLSEQGAIEMLRRLVGESRVDADRAAAARLARLCEYTPLALRIAGGKLSTRPEWSVADFAERLSDTHVRLDLLTHGELSMRDRLTACRARLARGNDAVGLRALELLGALDLPVVTEMDLVKLLDAAPAAAHLVAERLVDVGLIESLQLGRYRIPAAVRLLARETQSDLAMGRVAVQRVVDYYVDAIRGCVSDSRPGAQPRACMPGRQDRSAWYRAHRATLSQLSLIDRTDELHKAVDDLRNALGAGK
ncbi:NB-ARC domain-containing protein [Nocardia sp. CDC159]|uniref:NB-ARC domain-containing protein n=1 Tax=Nocardia pulmonis TaxID=2951408 RepID=A0A9X2E4B3_9NOCA|nr:MULTISPECIES: AfsR/SARP family transcriptional regulator [Nocardia]MCM6773984.1 NB-ARC domain-containing protein [Nocardia pulmonis]MCM6786871.1 NB-ARC domain-containing protein [Nocardia sp. CDC159]